MEMKLLRGHRRSLGIFSLFCAVGLARAGTTTFDFTQDPSTSNLIIVGNHAGEAYKTEGGNPGAYLSITDAVNSQNTCVIFPDFDGGKTVKAFTFSMDVRIGNGTGNSGRPADGFSISYARVGDPVLVSADGNGFAGGLPEAGTTTGIAVSFDAWSGNTLPDGGDVEGILVRVDNHTVLAQPLATRNGACDSTTSLQTGPWDGTTDNPNGTGLPDALCWQKIEVELTEEGQLTVKYKGRTLLDKFQTDYYPSAGQLVLSGRGGSANQNQHVDNIKITTIPADKPYVTALVSTPLGFTASIADAGDLFAVPDSIKVKFNGQDTTSFTKVRSGGITALSYVNPVLLIPGSTNSYLISFTDSSGTPYSVARTFVVGPYVAVPTSGILSVDRVDTTKPGFTARVHQISVPRFPGDENAPANAERQFADGYLDPVSGLAYPNLADITGSDNGVFTITDYINWNQDAAADIGNFTSTEGHADRPTPGIPGVTQSGDNVVAEIVTYLQLEAGVYTLGVNSDDGFSLKTGANPKDAFSPVLGSFETGRGSADTHFTAVVSTSGIYPVRLLWWQGNGGANLEFFSVTANGQKVLVNDRDNPDAIKAYSARRGVEPLYVKSVTPAVGARGVRPDTDLAVEIVNVGTSVDTSSLQLSLNGTVVPAKLDTSGGTVRLSLPSTGLLPSGSTNKATLVFADNSAPKRTFTNSWTFVVEAYTTLAGGSAPGSGTAGEPGFKGRVYQIATGTTTAANVVSRAEQELAGLMGPNVADLTSATNGIFNIDTVINFDQAAGLAGNFNADGGYPDALIPGIPGTTGSTDSIAGEFITYVEFPAAGYYQLGISSDDGFIVYNTDAPPARKSVLEITAPASIAGPLAAISAGSDGGGIALPLPVGKLITGKLIYSDPPLADADIRNGAAIKGNIALIDRGVATFTDKINRAQAVGAVAVIIVNNRALDNPEGVLPIVLGGTAVNLPAIMVSIVDGAILKSKLAEGVTVALGEDPSPRLAQNNGVSNLSFGVAAPAPGLYPFRAVWFEGNGGANLEWFSLTKAGVRVLLNDRSNTNALKTYRARTAPPVLTPTISIATTGGNLTITYAGVLQAADSVAGPYTDVTGATSPRVISSPAGNKFYRARQ